MARLLLITLLLPLVAAANTPVMRAYPVSYELAHVTAGGEIRVLSEGQAVLREGRTETLEPAASGEATGVRIALTATPGGRTAPSLIIDAQVAMRLAEGTRRASIGEGNESFIEAPRTREVRFSNRSWRRPADPAPVRVTHADGEERYRLTIRFRD